MIKFCFYHDEDIDGKAKMIGIEKPYANLFFCEDAIAEFRKSGIDGEEVWLREHAEKIYEYAKDPSGYRIKKLKENK